MIFHKFISSLLLVLISIVSASASTKMVIHQKSGGAIEVLLKDKPVARYVGSELVIMSETSTLRFQLKSIENMVFENLPSFIENLTILSKDAGTTLIYDFNGRLLKTVASGEKFETSTLPKGIYIIKNMNHSYKIVKR